MSEVLYRKYRPQKFSEVINQETVKTILKNAVRTARISHAYLFTGVRGVGKTTIARILAKAVNCLNPREGEPDATCENCRLIASGRFLDLLEIDAASYTGVDNIREIIEHVKFSPSKGRYKVFIIDEVHMLSKAAFNALLKTLEEPPAHAIFILATTEIHKVPATIVSRTQRFDFKTISIADILSLFEKVLTDFSAQGGPASGWEISLEARKLIASAAAGSFRDALSILDQVMSFADKEISLENVEDILGITRIETNQRFLDLILENNRTGAVEFVKKIAFQGKDLVQFTRNLLEYLRLVLFVKMGVAELSELGLLSSDEQKVVDQSKKLAGSRLLEIIKQILGAHRETKQSPVQELPLLTAVLALIPEKEEGLKPLARVPETKTNEAAGLNLGKIVDSWSQVLAKIKEYNHSLISSMRLGRIVRLEGEDLVLAFPYSFHKETIEARKNRIVVEQVLEETFNQKLRVKVFLERDLVESKDLVGEAIKVLGNGDSNLRMHSNNSNEN